MGTKVRPPGRISITFLLAVIALTLLGSIAEQAEARGKKFGFRGGFRGGFGRSFKRSGFHRSFKPSGFNRSFKKASVFKKQRFGSFRRFGFNGFRGFGRSKFNSLAFRGRRFGSGGFNKFNKFSSVGFRGSRRGFNTFKPGFNTFAFSHFPVQRFHSGFATFNHPKSFVANSFSGGPNHFTSVRFPSHVANGAGWTYLAKGQPVNAKTAFVDDISAGGSPGIARVGFALASADNGELDRGVWAMRRAFAADKDMAASLMMDEEMSEIVARVTRLYEQRMEDKGTNSEDAFMLAAMYQLQGDPEMAMMAMDYALNTGDKNVSTIYLNQLIESEMSTIPMTNSVGWELLAKGDNVEAARTFIDEIGKDEMAGAPKLGYALAMAAGGDLEKGTWAIRRAFDVDPEGTSDVVISGKLRSVVESVTEKYVADAETNGIGKDNSYSLATLFMLQGDIEAAELVAKNSPVDQDSYVVTMIVNEMKSQMTMMDEAMSKMDDAKEHSYDEFVASEKTSSVEDSISEGSGSKNPILVEAPVPEGSSSKNPVPQPQQGSGTKEPPVAAQGSSSKNPVEETPDNELPLLGSGSRTPVTNGSGTRTPASQGSGSRF